MEDGIANTRDDGSILSGETIPTGQSRRYGHPVAPLERMPPLSALRECLSLQSDSPPQSVFSRLFGVDPLAREARRSYSGAKAELAVVESLAALGSEWTVLHSVPVPVPVAEGGVECRTIIDHLVIDHLLIGPAGIFTLSVESHAGQSLWVGERTFIADGECLDHLAVADEASRAVSRLLTAALLDGGVTLDAVTTPCVVVDAPATLEVQQRPGRVHVVTARTFASWLIGLPRLISPAVVEDLVAVAASTATWPTSPHDHAESEAENRYRTAQFEQLRHRVSSARFRRLLWTGLGVVVSYAAVIVDLGGLTIVELTAALGR